MKPIILALLAGLALFGATFVFFRLISTEKKAKALLGLFLAGLPILIAAYLLTPDGLVFLPPIAIVPDAAVGLGFAVFLYAAGFFGGILQLYNLADRGFSLRILVDILESPSHVMTLNEVMTSYGGGRGIHWMYDKRVEGIISTDLGRLESDRLVLTARGYRLARVFAQLQKFARISPPTEAGR